MATRSCVTPCPSPAGANFSVPFTPHSRLASPSIWFTLTSASAVPSPPSKKFLMANTDSKRIARNTICLYIRTFVSMLIGLYTSRKILEALGVEDFGIMNVVGGVISLMAIINGSMSVATQRYLTYELGKGDQGDYSKVFNMAVYIHILLALIVLVAAETVGLWFVNTHLTIPESRMVAANWIYQASILSCLLGILQTPYNASIISHEQMHIYAYVGLGETFVRLAIVLTLLFYPYDRLALWGFAFFALQLVVAIIYRLYCIRHFSHCRLVRHGWNRSLFRSMLGFTGWNMFGTVAWTLKGQGTNVLLNIFGGPVVNAAQGIAFQVSAAVRNLFGGFQSAVNPQLTKTYAANDRQATCSLLCKSSKISFYLMFVVALPVIFEADFILNVWLVEVPPFAPLFTCIIICESLVDTLAGPMITSLMATGRIKWYQIVVSSVLILNIPVAYILLKLGLPIVTPLLLSVLFMILGNAARLLFCRSMIGLSLSAYLSQVILPILMVVAISVLLTFGVHLMLPSGWLRVVACTLMSVIAVTAAVFTVGLTSSERTFILSLIKPRIMRLIPSRT